MLNLHTAETYLSKKLDIKPLQVPPVLNSLEVDVPPFISEALQTFIVNLNPPGYIPFNFLDPDLSEALSDIIGPELAGSVKMSPDSLQNWTEDNPDELDVWLFEGVSPVFELVQISGSPIGCSRTVPEVLDYCIEDPLRKGLFTGVIFLDTDPKGLYIHHSDEKTHGIKIPSKGSVVVHETADKYTVSSTGENKVWCLRFKLFYSAISKSQES